MERHDYHKGWEHLRLFSDPTMLQSLPAELVLSVLRSLTIADIFNVSRTASYFRALSLANRSFWLDACDASKLVLPLGETLDTVDLYLLLLSAARTVSIAKKWSSATPTNPVHPLRTFEAQTLYQLPPYHFWSPHRFAQRSFLGHRPPPVLSVLPGGCAFILGDAEHLAVYDLRGEYAWELAPPFYLRNLSSGNVRSVAEARRSVSWDSVDNGAHTVIAVISSGFTAEQSLERYLSVFILDYKRGANTSSVHRLDDILLPIEANLVSVKGSHILVSCSDTVVLFNLAQSIECECSFGPSGDASIGFEQEDSVSVFSVPRPIQGFERVEEWPWSLWNALASSKSCTGTREIIIPDEIPDKGRVVTVDDVYGIVLVFARGRLWIVRY
ncbi:hypothetical protein C8F01DRAFT_748316 [Mycena amicta]|nr:hypothetical protein C8F01DRAFT_748316 [Mycena amicta]